MIIQCEQCKTKFKLDDSKVPEKGVKVRCVKCRYVFSVARELPAAEPGADFESMLETSVASAQDFSAPPTEDTAPEETPALEDTFAQEDTSALDFGDDVPLDETISATVEEEAEEDEETLFESDAFDLEIEKKVEQEPAPIEFDDIVESAPAAVGEETLFPAAQPETADNADNMDFGAFTFNGEEEDLSSSTMELDFGDTPTIEPPVQVANSESFGGLDFSDDDIFGAVVEPAKEDSDDAGGFDFGMDDFASSMGVDETVVTQKNAFAMSDSASDAPFSLDEIDFGDELTSVGVQHVNPEELKPSQELLFAPLAEAQSKPVSSTDAASFGAKPSAADELPPLSIASRRKQSPVFSVLIAVLGAAFAGIVAFYGYSMFTGDKSAATKETGHITVRNVDASFVKNKQTGDLLVISGEAVNDFGKPRAAIQVKGLVYGEKGEVISSKTAFCGNPLTEEQLSTMTMDKIEAAMANQFGDSLANMEVPPGKAVPFVIVIAKPATGAKDYGVEPAGSTVASGGKQ